MDRKKILISLICICVLMISWTVFTFAYVDSRKPVVEAEDGAVVSGESEWKLFLENTKQGKTDKITVTVYSDDATYEAIIKYTAGMYTYSDDNGNRYRSSHLVDVTGRWPGSRAEGRIIALTDGEYTFDELTTGLFSNDSEKIIRFYSLFW